MTRQQKQTGRGETLVEVQKLIIYQERGCVQAVSSRWMVQKQKWPRGKVTSNA